MQSIISIIPAIISQYFFWWYVYVNYLDGKPCNIEDGCMNESGMIMWLSFVFMIIAFAISFLMFVINHSNCVNRNIAGND